MCAGLGDVRVFQVAGGDGDGERSVEVALRRCRLVDVRLLLRLHRRWLEGWGGHGLMLAEVHQGEALVVASRCAVSCNRRTVRGEEMLWMCVLRWMHCPPLTWNGDGGVKGACVKDGAPQQRPGFINTLAPSPEVAHVCTWLECHTELFK